MPPSSMPRPQLQRADGASPVLRETADVLVLELMSAAMGRDLSSRGLPPWRHESLVGGLLATREVADRATRLYLEVKRHPAAEQPAVLTRLDPSGEQLFDVYADVLDELCGGAPLQHLVAGGVARVAFSSRFAARLVRDAAEGGDLALAAEEQPDARLQRVLESMESATTPLDDVLGPRMAQVAARVGLPPWDLHDEHAWFHHQGLHAEAVAVVEAELAQVVRPWLVHVADLPCLVGEELAQVGAGVRAWLEPTGPHPPA